jgi:hypothetical protein
MSDEVGGNERMVRDDFVHILMVLESGENGAIIGVGTA